MTERTKFFAWVILLFVAGGIVLWQWPHITSKAGISSVSSADPSILGFQQFFKCTGISTDLGDINTAEACLMACKQQSDTLGCWWSDGSNASPRNCHSCRTKPEKMPWSNNWAVDFSTNAAGNEATGNKSPFTLHTDSQMSAIPLVPKPASDNGERKEKVISDPAQVGFQKFSKCMNPLSLGDTITPDACLKACNAKAAELSHIRTTTASQMPVGCWWQDGKNEIPRNCNSCIYVEPIESSSASDWGMSIAPLQAPAVAKEPPRLPTTTSSGRHVFIRIMNSPR